MNTINKLLTEIAPYERNPRKNDNAVDAVAESIRRFGFLVPIVIDKDGIIVAGHTRHKAAVKLGLKSVPCVVAEELTEDEIRAFRLADNKVAELAEWDEELLPLELADIAVDMTPFGFDTVEEDAFGDDFTLDDGEKKPFQQISLTLHDEQAELLHAAIQYVYDNDMVRRPSATRTITATESMRWYDNGQSKGNYAKGHPLQGRKSLYEEASLQRQGCQQ